MGVHYTSLSCRPLITWKRTAVKARLRKDALRRELQWRGDSSSTRTYLRQEYTESRDHHGLVVVVVVLMVVVVVVVVLWFLVTG